VGLALDSIRGKVIEVRPLLRASDFICPIDQYPLKSLFLLTKLSLIAFAMPFNSLRLAISYSLILPIIFMSNFNVHYLDDANFKAAISEIKGAINHYHWEIFYVRFWH